MAARNYETLVNDFIDEYGIGGGGPLETISGQTEAVVGQTGDLKRACRWVRDAWDEIGLLWSNWDFLWFEHSVLSTDTPAGLAAASQTPTLPDFDVHHWDRTSFVLNRASSINVPMSFMEWPSFRDRFYRGTAATGTPRFITELPDGTLRCELLASAALDFYGAGWKLPTRLAADADVPDLPTNFDRIIIARSAIYYANSYDSPEDLEGAEADYAVLLNKLQSAQLPGFEYDTMSTPDVDLYRDIPGQQELGTVR